MTSVARPQTSTETGAVSSLPSSEPEPPAKADDLDKLLELADKDVSQLSQVKVAGVTGSASLDMPVSTVSRQESTVGKSPAAVFVITNEMIRRSGAKEIPEVLRMVPGLAVEKIDSSKWSVTVRGFGGRFASKLLVRIDGRDVYTPLYGGVFWDDIDSVDGMGERDHRRFRPEGWVQAGRARLEAMRPIAERHGLTMLQLAAVWNLAHPAVRCVAPTLMQEAGEDAVPVEAKRAELAAVPAVSPLSAEEVEAIRAAGDNTGSMELKGAATGYDGPVVADRWPITEDLAALGARYGVDADRDLAPAG